MPRVSEANDEAMTGMTVVVATVTVVTGGWCCGSGGSIQSLSLYLSHASTSILIHLSHLSDTEHPSFDPQFMHYTSSPIPVSSSDTIIHFHGQPSSFTQPQLRNTHNSTQHTQPSLLLLQHITFPPCSTAHHNGCRSGQCCSGVWSVCESVLPAAGVVWNEWWWCWWLLHAALLTVVC